MIDCDKLKMYTINSKATDRRAFQAEEKQRSEEEDGKQTNLATCFEE